MDPKRDEMTRKNGKLPAPYEALARKMILTILIVSFIPVFLVSLTIYFQFHGLYRQKVEDHLVEMVRKHKQQIDAFLAARAADVQFLADSFGRAQLSDETFLQGQLAALQRAYGTTFVDLGVVDAQGHQVSYAGPFKLNRADYSRAAWFKQVLAQRTVITDVFLGLRGLPHFIVATRYGQDDDTWILRATIDFESFNKLVSNIRIGTTGIAFIVNRAGEFQTTTSLPAAGKGCFAGFYACDADPSKKIHVFLRPDENGQESIFVTGLLKDRNWLLVYRQQAADAFSELHRAERMSLVFFVLGGVCLLVMAFVLSRRMVTRVAQADREKELMSRQVIEAGKLAGIGELAAGVAHEINNPVAVMIEEAGWIQDLMSDGSLDTPENQAEVRRALKQIHTQGQRCKEITRNLLSFARGSDSRNRPLDVNRVIGDVFNLLGQRAKYAQVAVETRLAPNLPLLTASETEMHQVMLNLVSNALQAMDKEGGGRLTVSTALADGKVVIEVTDTGPGIPEAILPRIFDPFFTTKPVGQGTGLGLSICYGIIHNMGGQIEVESRVGQGTSFRVILPVQTVDETDGK